VLVVTSKVVSKAEGRLLRVPDDPVAAEAARQEAISAEAVAEVARRGTTRIVRTRHGLVLASAGIDTSNVDRGWLVLLPVDPDASARRLRQQLRHRYGVDVAVIISDTMGRPWRIGLVDTAIGAAGISPLLDHRGRIDRYGNELHMTQTAVIDELAAAADLVKGKLSGVPVAVVRGLDLAATWSSTPSSPDADPTPDGPGAAALVRSGEGDMFALGTREAWAAGRREVLRLAGATEQFTDEAVDSALLTESARSVGLDVIAVTVREKLLLTLGDAGFPDDPAWRTAPLLGVPLLPPGARDDDPVTYLTTGSLVQRLLTALAAAGLGSRWVPWVGPWPEPALALFGAPAGSRPAGLIAVGHPAS